MAQAPENSLTPEFIDLIGQIVGAHAVFLNEPLSMHTTFKIGGPAECFVTPQTEQHVCEIVAECRRRNVPWRVLGLGSNVLAPDAGLSGVVIHLGENFANITVCPDGRIVAQAGATNKAVADAALAASLTGYEFACGIPGSIGGAAYMNAGAYDGSFSDVCETVRCLLPSTGEIVDVPGGEADWGYRHSIMMEKGYVILGATLALTAGNAQDIKATMDDLTARREASQPLEMPSAGSTFKRPEGYYAGALIQQAHMQGECVGDAQVSPKHAGFVVNRGNATAADVLGLIAKVQDAVERESGVRLEPEVRLWS